MNIRLSREDKNLYKKILTISVPMMIQNGVSNFVSLLDNLMIGRVGTNALSGVAIANQLIFVFYLLLFGATAGVGIFTAQYFGKGDTEGVRVTFRFKILANLFLSACCIFVLYVYSEYLVGLFLKGEGDASDAAETLKIGVEYIRLMLIGLVPVGIMNAYSGTLRDIGKTKVPMMASVVAIFVNLIGNAILIYGLFGLPALGAKGAAIATILSRFVELGILVIYTGTHADKIEFIKGAFRNFHIPGDLAVRFIIRSLPLLANETLWSLGVTVMNQCYSYRSLSAVAAINIESTIWNLCGVLFLAMGEANGIVMGHILGSGDTGRAKKVTPKMIGLTFAAGLVCGILLIIASPFFPMLYKTGDNIRHLATTLILIYGCITPLFAITHATYFIIRSGGNTLVTFLFDSCFVWLISVPTAYILSRHTDLSVVRMIVIVQSAEIIKCTIGLIMVRSGIWAKKIVK